MEHSAVSAASSLALFWQKLKHTLFSRCFPVTDSSLTMFLFSAAVTV